MMISTQPSTMPKATMIMAVRRARMRRVPGDRLAAWIGASGLGRCWERVRKASGKSGDDVSSMAFTSGSKAVMLMPSAIGKPFVAACQNIGKP